MKKFMSLALAGTIALSVLAGCTQSNPGTLAAPSVQAPVVAPNPAPAVPAQKVSIGFWNSAEGNTGVVIGEIVDEFNSTIGKEKNIEVTSVFQGGDVAEKLKTLSQAEDWENFPDVGQIYGLSIPAIMEMSPNIPVEDMYTKGENIIVQKNDIQGSFVRAFSYADKMIGMPLNGSTLLMYYNKDAYREVGLDPEKPAATIAELAEHVAKLTQKEGSTVKRYGLNAQIDRYRIVNFLGGMGAFNFIGDNEGGRSADMTKLTIGEDGTLKKYLTEWEKVIKTGGFKAVNDNEKEEFGAGLSAINFQSTAQMANMKKLSEGKFELGAAPLPKVEAGDKGGTAIGGGSLCLFDRKDPARLAAAWEFVQFCATPEIQFDLHMKTGYMPVNKKTYDIPEMIQHLTDDPLYKIAIDQVRNSNPNVQEPFDIIGWEFNTLVKSSMIEFADGKLTLDQTHDAIVNEFNAKLEQYHKANK